MDLFLLTKYDKFTVSSDEGGNTLSDSVRRNMAVFPISVVMKLTDLSARQIRYYETLELIIPERTAGNQRLFSMNDLDTLLEIKKMLEQGFNIKRIKAIFSERAAQRRKSDDYYLDFNNPKSLPINRGDLSRFYK